MCNTMVAVGDATADGVIILAKNSDRQPNEAQALVHIPRARHEDRTMVKCTYIELPQVRETYEALLSKPFWIWGCEMGANECGVTIGNEAVFSKVPAGKEPGLIGMDFIRLALERADTARQALELIIELLETYGQSGNCGHRIKEHYHNSFIIIADPTEAWVLETVAKFWVAERVRDVRAISNGLTIGNEWDMASPGLVEYAIKRGWCKSREDFHFARCFSDFLYTRFSASSARQRRTTELLEAKKGNITVETMMDALRDHGPRAAANPSWRPADGVANFTVCCHVSWGPIRFSGTTGSLVSHLAPDLQTHWLTGTSAPCTSIFKPIYLEAGLPYLGPEPTDTYDPAPLWWNHEQLHRSVLKDYATRIPLYCDDRDSLEAEFLAQAAGTYERYRDAPNEERAEPLAAFTATCFERASDATEGWIERVSAAEIKRRPSWLYRLAWRRVGEQAGFTQ